MHTSPYPSRHTLRHVSRRFALARWIGPLAAAALWIGSAAAQTTAPATSPVSELPAALRQALDSVQDFAFNFDIPAFYGLVEFVKAAGQAPGFVEAPIGVSDWKAFLERPSDFRGRPVTIEGIVGRNKDPFTTKYPQLGPLSQLELRRDDQPLSVTLILTDDARDIPIGATIAVTGYFLMLRQYYGPGQKAFPAALIVARGPSQVLLDTPASSAPLNWTTIGWGIAVAVLIAWIVLKRVLAVPRERLPLRPRQPAPLSLADDLAAWAESPRHFENEAPHRPGDDSLNPPRPQS